MIRRCVKAGLPEPEFTVPQGFVTTVWRAALAEQYRVQAGVQAGVQAELPVKDIAMLQACVREAATSRELWIVAGYSTRTRSFEKQLGRLLADELLEMTVPDKPRSPLQKYRLTDKGRAALSGPKTKDTEA